MHKTKSRIYWICELWQIPQVARFPSPLSTIVANKNVNVHFPTIEYIPVATLFAQCSRSLLRRSAKFIARVARKKIIKSFFLLRCRSLPSSRGLMAVVGEWKIMDILIKNNRTLNGSWLLSTSERPVNPLLNLPETFINHIVRLSFPFFPFALGLSSLIASNKMRSLNVSINVNDGWNLQKWRKLLSSYVRWEDTKRKVRQHRKHFSDVARVSLNINQIS